MTVLSDTLGGFWEGLVSPWFLVAGGQVCVCDGHTFARALRGEKTMTFFPQCEWVATGECVPSRPDQVPVSCHEMWGILLIGVLPS